MKCPTPVRLRHATPTRPLALLACVALVALVACGTAQVAVPSQTIETSATGLNVSALDDAAMRWATAFLLGRLDDVNHLRSATCDPLTAATLAIEREDLREAVGQDLGTLHVVRVETRNVTSASAQAAIVTDLPGRAAGVDNWVSFRLEDAWWRLDDCDRLPITAPPSATTSSPSPPAAG